MCYSISIPQETNPFLFIPKYHFLRFPFTFIVLYFVFFLSVSDHLVYRGGGDHSITDLPQEEAVDRHRSHQRGQQVCTSHIEKQCVKEQRF